jgi:hypothetical protein
MSVESIVGPGAKPKPDKESLKDSIDELVIAVRTLVEVFEKAKEEIKSEPTEQVLKRLDELAMCNRQMLDQNREILEQTTKTLSQNKDIAHSLILLLDLHREHLPEIAKHTRVTSEVRRVDELGSPRAHPIRRKQSAFDDLSPLDPYHP